VIPALFGVIDGAQVGAFNVYNLEGALAVADAASAAGGFPALLQVHPSSLAFGGVSLLAACLEVCSASPSPLLVQLDHAADAADVHLALAAGVHGVMVDGSHLPYDQNARWTRELAAAAHAGDHDFFDLAFENGAKVPGSGKWVKVSVEAELGKLAGEVSVVLLHTCTGWLGPFFIFPARAMDCAPSLHMSPLNAALAYCCSCPGRKTAWW